MSRQYMNSKWCVRCGRQTPTPYLRDNVKLLAPPSQGAWCVDVGCGNGRNSVWAEGLGYTVTGLDMAPKSCATHGEALFNLGTQSFPFAVGSVELFLCNYVFMFCNKKEREQIIHEIHRTAESKAKLVIELYPAKDSETKTDAACTKLRDALIREFTKRAWTVLRKSKHRCILQAKDWEMITT